ncbi:Translation initiation factor eIF-2B subunit alpha [Ceratocystis fimbriata CBS 114723]|uniref:Translation initiation factor eIF2B subunit alpha n=1 Tax=Ceratocystis fimbriata CBS 114723 TaxID=1035309 RepID=A0A2C5X3S1_9PEZI|nr:Translation initiation factor eIF-2B subunit alpha [Ceratocystis fimbriata CBS 114723]
MASTTQDPLQIRPKTAEFDIVGCYNTLLAENPDLTQPVAAIEALIAMLNASSSSTVYETLESTTRYANLLKEAVHNPLPLTAGTDLFQQFLLSSLKQQEGSVKDGLAVSFDALRVALVQNGSLFAQRAREARDRIAAAGWRFVRDDECVLTHGASRTVSTLLIKAAKESRSRNNGTVRFKVIYVRDAWRVNESDRIVNQLRAEGIPVAEIPSAAVAHVMAMLRQVHVVFIGAEAVTQDGGVISRLGTLQLARLARHASPPIPFYVAAEEHKFLRRLPRYQDDADLGCSQSLLDFTTDKSSHQPENPIDWTDHTYITNLITENGVKSPSYVTEQLIEIYGTLTPQMILDKVQFGITSGR